MTPLMHDVYIENYLEVWSRTAPDKTIACCFVLAYMELRMRTVQAATTNTQSLLLWLRDITCFICGYMAAADIVAISSEIRFNALVSVNSLAASLACCGTTYCSPSLPMFAFVLDAGNVAPLLLWAAGRGGRACVCVAGRRNSGRCGTARVNKVRGG